MNEPYSVSLKEIKPALAGYIRESQLLLKESAVPDERVVHDVRVLMKRSRAVLKLAGSQMDKEWLERNMVALRETGRLLSVLRDTSVQRKILKELRKDNPSLFASMKDFDKLASMIKKPEHFNLATPDVFEIMANSEMILKKASYRIRFEPMANLDASFLFRELERTYLDVMSLYLECRSFPKPEKIHQFRKRAKDFLYQLYFFRPLNPSVIRSVEKRFESLTQSLGKYCDLKQLVLDLGYEYSRSSQMSAIDELIVLIRKSQDIYLSKVWSVANKIFRPGKKLVNLLEFRLLLI
jgi:CHAD domain-containing protein